VSRRADALAKRLEQGARELEAFAQSLSDVEWQIKVPKDGRTVGVMVHHVASVYPLEIQIAQSVAGGKAVTGVTWDDVAKMNAEHAQKHASIGQREALELLRQNSKAAAEAVRAFSDEQLDAAAAVSLNSDAPLTAQFVIEDHALRHSFHHLARIRGAVGR
jgi:hypothetical protein